MLILKTMSSTIVDLFFTAGTPLAVDKGMHIFYTGELTKTIYLIQSGLVQLTKETEQAKELTIRICSGGSIIGESLLFSPSTQQLTAKALAPTKLYTLNTELLEHYLTTQPLLMLDYVKWVQTENLKQQSRLRDLLLLGKKGALYSTLIRLANTYGEWQLDGSVAIQIHLTNTDIANLCGTSRELVNRFLADLRKEQMITTEHGYLTILNVPFLKQAIACDDCPLAICRID